MKKKSSNCFSTLAQCSSLFSGFLHDSGVCVVKFSHVASGTTHPKVILINAFAVGVNRKMSGTLCIEVYPNSTSFASSKGLEALLLGDVQLLASSIAKFGVFTEKYAVFDLPFFFKGLNQVIPK